jgi:hypothetical protein
MQLLFCYISLSSAEAGLSLELCLDFYWVIFNQREMEMNFSFRKLEMGKRHHLTRDDVSLEMTHNNNNSSSATAAA